MDAQTDIFLSWSGEQSRKVAEELRDWFPLVLPTVHCFLSSDIPAGARWAHELAHTLETSSFGIFCITPENLRAPWIMFEAGAVSKARHARAVPVLFWCRVDDLEGPLSQFQAIEFGRRTFKNFAWGIANTLGMDQHTFVQAFRQHWPELNDIINDLHNFKMGTFYTCKFDRRYTPPISNICQITEKQIQGCLTSKGITQDARLRIAHTALQLHLGDRAKGEDNVLDFIFGVINRTIKDEPFIRENHHDDITLDVPNPTIPSERNWHQRKCVKWERTVSYDVCRINDQTSWYPLTMATNCMVEENWLEDFLAEFEYKITVDNIVIFEWQSLAPKVSADRLKNGEEIKLKDERGLTKGVCKVRFEKGALYIEFIDDIMLEKTTSAFKVKETSFLRYDENYYYWSIRHPTRNLTCTATLGRGLKKWAMREPSLGPKRYYPSDGKRAPSVRREDNEVSVHVPTWVLPGIVLVLEWSHPVDVGETFLPLQVATAAD